MVVSVHAGRESVLDIGSGDRPFFGGMAPRNYRTMDIDRGQSADSTRPFLCAKLSNTFPGVFYSYLEKIHAVLNPGGIPVVESVRFTI
jgi:hypothetical protein